jgi:hypothetical protein
MAGEIVMSCNNKEKMVRHDQHILDKKDDQARAMERCRAARSRK